MNWSSQRARLRTNLWTIPGAAAVAATLLAKGVAAFERRVGHDAPAWYLFGGQPESARELLSTIASSILAFTGVVFPVTILVLQLASSQFSPRVLRTFLEDGYTRASMGVFIGSFVYALALLPEIRNGAGGEPAFVPAFAVFLAFLLTLVSVLFFVRYIHQMAHSIRAVQVLRRVGAEARRGLTRLYPDPDR